MKRFVVICLCLFFVLPVSAQRPKVALVLSGGGAKGSAHVGVLKVLEQNDIQVDCIVGASMGAIVGGLYAMGYSADELDSLMMIQDWNTVLMDTRDRRLTPYDSKRRDDGYLLKIPLGAGKRGKLSSNLPSGLVRGQNVETLLTALTAGCQDSIDFKDLKIPFACVAVDLMSRREVVFRSGDVISAIRSSMSIPLFFDPLQFEGMALVDGGMLNNYPVDVARAMGADIVIGSIVSETEKDDKEKKEHDDDIMSVAMDWLDVYVVPKNSENAAGTDILIKPDLLSLNALSYSRENMRNLIDSGEKAALEHVGELKALIEKTGTASAHGQKASPYKATVLGRDSITVASIIYNGLTPDEESYVSRGSLVKPGARVPGDAVLREVDRLYALGVFERVNFRLRGREEPYSLELFFTEGKPAVFGLGAYFDTEEVIAALVRLGLGDNTLYGSSLNVEAKVAYNFRAGAEYAYGFRNRLKFKLGYNFGFSDFDLFRKEYLPDISFRRHSAFAGFGIGHIQNLSVNALAGIDIFRAMRLSGDDSAAASYDRDMSRNNFFDAHFDIGFENHDRRNFPTKGIDFNIETDWYKDFFTKFQHDPFSAFAAHISGVIPVGKQFVLIPSLDHRGLLGENVPAAYMNVMGGHRKGRYMNQQLTFVGFNNVHVFKKILSTATIDARFCAGGRHYITASGSVVANSDGYSDFFRESPFFGARLGYAYDSFLGPLSMDVCWSDYTGKVGFYMSLGFAF